MKKNITCLVIVVLLAILGVIGIKRSYRNSKPATPIAKDTVSEPQNSESSEDKLPESPGYIFPTSADQINWEDRSIFRDGLVAGSVDVLENLPLATTYYISLDIPEDIISNITGHLTVRYFNAEQISLDRIYFRLFPNFQGGTITVSNLTVDGNTTEFTLESLDPREEENPLPTALRVELSSELQPGGSVVIELDFSLGVPTEMGGHYGVFGYFEDVLVLDTFYPMIPAYDQKDGWYSGFPQPNGDHTYNDASFYIVQVQAPSDLIMASSGVEVTNQNSEGKQTVVFAAGPARDFYLAGSRNYVVLEETTADLTIRVLTWEEYQLHQELALNFARDAIGVFSERFGDYTYTEFDIVSAPMRALGIEYPGITNLTVDEFVDGAEMYGAPTYIYLESTTVHEVAHMWFYNAAGNDQQNEPWLDEALAQYLTYIYYLDKYGSGVGYTDSWYGRWSRVENAEIPIGLSAGYYHDEETGGLAYGAIVYGRGPIFYLELEKEYGLDMVVTAIRDYYQDNLWGVSQPEDMLAALENSCECDLDEFWNEWVYGE